MSPTGLIFGALAAFWLVYLVPLLLNRRDHGMPEDEPAEPFSSSVRIVRRGTPLDSAENGTAVVSTPLNRRAALRELAALDADAAARRRNVLAVLVLALLVTAALAGFAVVSWWTLALPAGLMAAFLAVARVSVRAMRRDLDARARVIRGGDAVDEPTVEIRLADLTAHDNEVPVELTAPIETAGSLWDPIPVTTPTYVSQPLAPRTARTIDLSAPIPGASPVPVTADLPADAAADAPVQLPRAVGE